MSPTVEFEGKTVEKALKAASQKLNIPEGKLKHDVISHGSSGIFGLVGTKKARIRVNVPETENKGKGKPSVEGKQASESEKKPPTAKKKTPATDKKVSAARKKSAATKKSAPRAETKTPTEEMTALAEANPEVESSVQALIAETFDQETPQLVTPELIEIGKNALQTMVACITSEASIEALGNKDRIAFNITGGNTAILIGKRGQTLEAMQYLVEKIVNKQGSDRIRVDVDVEGYIEGKRQKLEALALKLSERVKRTQKPATVGQLNAHDRRIVHLALKADNAVRTHSIGEGFYRKLKIFPKQRTRKPRSK